VNTGGKPVVCFRNLVAVARRSHTPMSVKPPAPLRAARRLLLVSALALGALIAPGLAAAGPATDVVKAKQTTLFELIKKGGSDSDKKIAALFDDLLDYQSLAQESLGTEWAARSDKEKKEFSDLLKQLVQAAYKKNLTKTVGFTISYVAEEGTGPVVVKTKAQKSGTKEDPIEIHFKLQQKGTAWKVQDIVTEGVSLVSSYRSQFTKIIKKDGFATLVQKMKDKIAKGDG
jgi:phospholipid transport system substrate-binding protein